MSNPAASTGSLQTTIRLFKHVHYRTYATGNFISLVGTWMQRITVGWVTWDLTGSGTWLGAVVFAELFPVLILGPVAGAIADRTNLLFLVKATQLVAFIQAALLAALFVLGLLTIEWLVVLALLLGLNSPFYQAARLAVVHALVPPEDLGPAIAFNAILFNLARFVGPAAAGIIIATAGITWGFIANAASCLVFVIALLFIPNTIASPRSRSRKSALSQDILEGFRYAFRVPIIRDILLLTVAIGVTARPVVELLPAFANSLYAAGATGLAALMAAVGVGAIGGGIWMMGRATRPNLFRSIGLCSLFSALVIIAFVYAGYFPLALLAMTLLGFFMVAAGIAGQTMIHQATDNEMRGRVLSTWGLLQRGIPALGSLLLGVISDAMGFVPAGAVAGVLLAVIALHALHNRRGGRI